MEVEGRWRLATCIGEIYATSLQSNNYILPSSQQVCSVAGSAVKRRPRWLPTRLGMASLMAAHADRAVCPALLTSTLDQTRQPQQVWPPNVRLRVDVKNAFHTVDHAVMLRAMYVLPQLRACWRMVAFSHGQPSMLLMRCHHSVDSDEAVMESYAEVRQGDLLAALLFSVAMHDVYDSVAGTVCGGCFAYMDDTMPVSVRWRSAGRRGRQCTLCNRWAWR